jgi:hypothetical protein
VLDKQDNDLVVSHIGQEEEEKGYAHLYIVISDVGIAD